MVVVVTFKPRPERRRAKRAAHDGPVIITDRGKPAHVLLSFDEYQRITGRKRSLLDILCEPAGIEDIDFDFNISRSARLVDLS